MAIGRVFNAFNNALSSETITGDAVSGAVELISSLLSHVIYQIGIKATTSSTIFDCDITEKSTGYRYAMRSSITGSWTIFVPKFACGSNSKEDQVKIAISSASADELFTVKIWYY